MTACDTEAVIAAARTILEEVPLGLEGEFGRRSLKFQLMCEAGVGTVDPNASDPIRDFEFTDQNVDKLVTLANEGDPIAHDALYEIADNLTKRAKPLKALQQYVVQTARDGQQSKRGRHPDANLYRDFHICLAVKRTTELGLYATRSDATADKKSKACGCSVVASALEQLNINMTEGAVKKIWDKRNREFFKRIIVGN